jgi:hypothetical protein
MIQSGSVINMCWLFHKWDKWSDIYEEVWQKQAVTYGYPVGDPFQYIRKTQKRVCNRCGKIEIRYID